MTKISSLKKNIFPDISSVLLGISNDLILVKFKEDEYIYPNIAEM